MYRHKSMGDVDGVEGESNSVFFGQTIEEKQY
jgi:hypothetical protein